MPKRELNLPEKNEITSNTINPPTIKHDKGIPLPDKVEDLSVKPSSNTAANPFLNKN